MAGETDAAEAARAAAVTLLEPTGDAAALAHASLYDGAILAHDRRPRARRADASSTRASSRCAPAGTTFAALALNYLGIARVELGDPAGSSCCARASRGDGRPPVRVRRARLLQPRRAARARRPPRRARGVRRRGPALLARARVLVARLQPRGPPLHRADPPRPLGRRAAPGCTSSSTASTTRACCYAYSVPWLGARCSPAAATRRPVRCSPTRWERARAQRLLLGLAYAGLAYVEWAWLTGGSDVARGVAAELLPRRHRRRSGGPTPFRRGRAVRAARPARGPARRLAAAAAGRPATPTSAPSTSSTRRAGRDRRGLPHPRRARRRPAGRARPRRACARWASASRAARAGTPANPAGLTERQLAVLGC